MTITDRSGGVASAGTPTMSDRRTGIVAGLAIKVPVKAATTANITLSGAQTIDGVSCVADDRVLVKDQSTTSQNGIYVVSTGPWTRAADFDSVDEITRGTLVYVAPGGSSNGAGGGSLWAISSVDPTTIDSSSISFTEFLLGSIAGFSAHKGSVDQTGLSHNAYTKVTFTTELYDYGGAYDATLSRVTLPVGLIHSDLQAWCSAHAADSGNPSFIVKLVKNGATDVKSGIGTATVGFAGTASAKLSCDFYNDSASNYYEVFFYGTSDTAGNNLQLDGNPAHTFWTMHWRPLT